MEEDQTKGKPNWALGLQIFSEVSGWVVGPIVVALILGKYLDKRFMTAPWIFLGLTAVAFIISLMSIIKVVKRYIKDIENEK